MNKIRIIALFGESGAGKDTVLRQVVKEFQNVYPIVGYTTRPKRDYEREGYDYHFVSESEFLKNNNFIENTKFNNWYYGISINDLKERKTNIGIFSMAGLKKILNDNRLDVLPVYIYASPKERLKRCLNREMFPDCEEICRRFLADLKANNLSKVKFPYIKYHNEFRTDLDLAYWSRIVKW